MPPPAHWELPVALELPRQDYLPLILPTQETSQEEYRLGLVEDLTLEQLRRHCADTIPEPCRLTREGGFYGLSHDDGR